MSELLIFPTQRRRQCFEDETPTRFRGTKCPLTGRFLEDFFGLRSAPDVVGTDPDGRLRRCSRRCRADRRAAKAGEREHRVEQERAEGTLGTRR